MRITHYARINYFNVERFGNMREQYVSTEYKYMHNKSFNISLHSLVRNRVVVSARWFFYTVEAIYMESSLDY